MEKIYRSLLIEQKGVILEFHDRHPSDSFSLGPHYALSRGNFQEQDKILIYGIKEEDITGKDKNSIRIRQLERLLHSVDIMHSHLYGMPYSRLPLDLDYLADNYLAWWEISNESAEIVDIGKEDAVDDCFFEDPAVNQ